MQNTESRPRQHRFGDYLKRIREGRKLSLDTVEEMSASLPERITKSHLSRIENGQATPTFPRMFTLSQIYGVPVTQLAEKFELELWQGVGEPVQLPATIEETFEKLDRLRMAGNYVSMLRLVGPATEQFHGSDRVGDLRLQYINCLLHLERYESAKLEAESLLGCCRTPRQRIQTLIAFATACARLRRSEIAQVALREATTSLASVPGDPDLEAQLQAQLGVLLALTGKFLDSAKCFERAHEIYSGIPRPYDACRAQINYAVALAVANEIKRATKIIAESLIEAEKSGFDRLQALALSHLATLRSQDKGVGEAEMLFLRSNQLARRSDYSLVIFRNAYHLWKIYRERGDDSSARSNEKTLRSYLLRVDQSLPEASAYRTYVNGDRES